MKKIIPLVCLVLLTGMLQAQSIHASTSYKQFRYWNPATSKFDRSGDNVEYSSMFVLNGDETMFTHTTNDIKSSYYINKKTYMDGCSCYSYDVTSDVGNKYTFFVDLDKDMVKIMSIGHADEHDDYLIIFTIKKHWKD